MPKLRKDLCADALTMGLRSSFSKIPDNRRSPSIPLSDILMSAYAVFSLKHPSLLAFEKSCRMPEHERGNMRALFGVEQVPSDTSMREAIDEVDPSAFRSAFQDLFTRVQRGKALEQFRYLDGKYLISMDGTGLFSSNKVHCDSCMVKTNRKTGENTYYHQMLGMVIVHPELRSVIPLCPEPILKQDGDSKNDCERNAAKRAITAFRQDHPKLQAIILEDGLAANAPHIRMLQGFDLSYIISAKPGDHKYLFEQAHLAGSASNYLEHEGEDGFIHKFTFVNDLPLNESNEDLRVNFLDYEQYNPKTKKTIKFTWITDIELNKDNVEKVMRAGRSRWRIENETFNTLKNQGYNFEHNYGHGNKHLCTNFAMLMFLAFGIDQIQNLCCQIYRTAREKAGAFYQFCGVLLHCFKTFEIPDWEALLNYLGNIIKVPIPTGPPDG